MGQYLVGDAVWALLPKCHYWPGLIVEPKEPAYEWQKSSDDIFIYFFGLASYGWIKRTDILPYAPNKEQLKLNGLKYFQSLDETAVNFFVAGGQEIDIYVAKHNLINVLEDGSEKVEYLKILISSANVYSDNYDKLRDCPSLVFAVAKHHAKWGFIRDIHTATEISGRMNYVPQPPIDFGPPTFPEEDGELLQKFIDSPCSVKLSSLFQKHGSDRYKTGDMVWAKMTGYAPWPGIVIDPVSKNIIKQKPKGKGVFYCIYFYGSHSHGWIANSALLPYIKYRSILSLKGLDDSKQNQIHCFHSACIEGDNEYLKIRDIKLGKVDPYSRVKLQEKMETEKQKYGFKLFNEADDLTSLGYKKILLQNFPEVIPGEFKFEVYVDIVRDMGISEFIKRKSQMGQEERDGIYNKGEEIGLYGLQRKRAKKPKSVEEVEEEEHVTNVQYTLRHPKKVLKKKRIPKKKTEVPDFFKMVKKLPKFEPYTFDDERMYPKNPVYKTNYIKLFEYLISEDDLNRGSGTISTVTINKLCQVIIHDYDEDQDVSVGISAFAPSTFTCASGDISNCKQCTVPIEKLNIGMMQRIESTCKISVKDKKLVILSNSDNTADVAKENSKERHVLTNADKSVCSEINQTPVTQRYDIPRTSGCSRANEVQLSEREEIPISENNSDSDDDSSDCIGYEPIFEDDEPYDLSLTEEDIDFFIDECVANTTEHRQYYYQSKHVSDNDDLSSDVYSSSTQAKEKTVEYIDNSSSTKLAYKELVKKTIKQIKDNLRKYTSHKDRSIYSYYPSVSNIGEEEKAPSYNKGPCGNIACYNQLCYFKSRLFLSIMNPLKRKSTSTNSINLSTTVNNTIELNINDTAANMDVDQQSDTPSTSYQNRESSL